MAARKTQRQRNAEYVEKEHLLWDDFRRSVEAIRNFVEAQLLVQRPPMGPNQPGRRYYSNLAFFLGQFQPPGDASPAEARLYIAMLQRFDSDGQLKPGAAVHAIAVLRSTFGLEDESSGA